MKTLTIAAAFLAGGVLLGSTSAVVAGELITGKQIQDGSLTGKDIKPNSVPSNRIKPGDPADRIGGDRLELETISFNTVTEQWTQGPTLATFTEDQVTSALLSARWQGDVAASGGACQIQLRIGATAGTVVGVENGIKSPRDTSSGMATGKRQHKPLAVTMWYRGTADSCVLGSQLNPSQLALTYQKIEW